jgi:hypothetical protein
VPELRSPSFYIVVVSIETVVLPKMETLAEGTREGVRVTVTTSTAPPKPAIVVDGGTQDTGQQDTEESSTNTNEIEINTQETHHGGQTKSVASDKQESEPPQGKTEQSQEDQGAKNKPTNEETDKTAVSGHADDHQVAPEADTRAESHGEAVQAVVLADDAGNVPSSSSSSPKPAHSHSSEGGEMVHSSKSDDAGQKQQTDAMQDAGTGNSGTDVASSQKTPDEALVKNQIIESTSGDQSENVMEKKEVDEAQNASSGVPETSSEETGARDANGAHKDGHAKVETAAAAAATDTAMVDHHVIHTQKDDTATVQLHTDQDASIGAAHTDTQPQAAGADADAAAAVEEGDKEERHVQHVNTQVVQSHTDQPVPHAEPQSDAADAAVMDMQEIPAQNEHTHTTAVVAHTDSDTSHIAPHADTQDLTTSDSTNIQQIDSTQTQNINNNIPDQTSEVQQLSAMDNTISETQTQNPTNNIPDQTNEAQQLSATDNTITQTQTQTPTDNMPDQPPAQETSITDNTTTPQNTEAQAPDGQNDGQNDGQSDGQIKGDCGGDEEAREAECLKVLDEMLQQVCASESEGCAREAYDEVCMYVCMYVYVSMLEQVRVRGGPGRLSMRCICMYVCICMCRYSCMRCWSK